MTLQRWIFIGRVASAILAVIAAFLGVAALFLLGSILFFVLGGEVDASTDLRELIGWSAFLLVSLCAAVTPFLAWNFFYDCRVARHMTARHARLAKGVGWMMAVVAVPWWALSMPVTWDNITFFQGPAHTVFQTILTSTPSVLASACAVSAFKISRIEPNTHHGPD